MHLYKIIVAYDGTDFSGWQTQNHKPTVAHTLEKAYLKIFGQEIRVIGVSRTDAGVHARGQVAVFRATLALDLATMQWAWNNKLPQSLKISSLELVDASYNPFHNIDYKTYRYHIFLERPSPVVARYGLHVRKKVDVEKLRKVLALFVGTHDFRSFCTGDERENTVRTIDSITIIPLKRYNGYRIQVQGKTFLRYMIRRIVGAALACATSPDIAIAHVQKILDLKNPRHTLPNASAQGLMLYKITYKK